MNPFLANLLSLFPLLLAFIGAMIIIASPDLQWLALSFTVSAYLLYAMTR